MKRCLKIFISLFIIILIPVSVIAQVPQKIQYQTVLLTHSGLALPGVVYDLQLSIISDSIDGNTIYRELHHDTTAGNGMISVYLGTGTPSVGIFSSIDWAGSNHYLKTEIDTSGSGNFIETGISQFLSSPYAQATQTFSSDQDKQSLSVSGDTLFLSNGNYVILEGANLSTFSCGDILVDDRDGQYYHTVKIGYQCWMAENLNYGNFIESTIAQTNNSMIEKYCLENSVDSCSVYGGFYMWDEMMDYGSVPGTRGICPEGWHIPEDHEWDLLGLTYESPLGGYLKEEGYDHWNEPNTGANNESGFGALAAGWVITNDPFSNYLEQTIFWSSTLSSSGYCIGRTLQYDNDELWLIGDYCDRALSLRCVQD